MLRLFLYYCKVAKRVLSGCIFEEKPMFRRINFGVELYTDKSTFLPKSYKQIRLF